MKATRLLSVGIVVAAAFAMPHQAVANLVYDSSIHATGQGFGAAPRALTLQATGASSTTESGCVGVGAGGAITFGTCITDASVHLGNGVSNLNGTGDMPNPLTAGLKYGIPTIGSLGITTASQIAILFNATEPSGDSANVIDLTLKFYSASGTFLGAIDGQQNFLSTNPGNGVAGFTFVVDLAQQAYVNSLLLLGGSGTTLALESTITDVAGGPESFLIYNLSNPGGPGTSIPEPAEVALMGLGLLGIAWMRKRNRMQ